MWFCGVANVHNRGVSDNVGHMPSQSDNYFKDSYSDCKILVGLIEFCRDLFFTIDSVLCTYIDMGFEISYMFYLL